MGAHADILSFLAGKRGAPKIEETDPHGYQALMWAAKSGSVSTVTALIDKQADINAANELGETPLMIAAAEGHASVVRTLLDYDANPDAKDVHGWVAVQKAAWWGHAAALSELFLEQKPDESLLRSLMTAVKLQGHTNCLSVIDGTAGPNSFAKVNVDLVIGGTTSEKDVKKQVKESVAASTKEHGVVPGDVCIAGIEVLDSAPKGPRTVRCQIRVQSSSPVGIMRSLNAALADEKSALCKNSKLMVDTAASKTGMTWPLKRIAKAVGDKYGDEIPSLKAIDHNVLENLLEAVTKSMDLYEDVQNQLQETEPEMMKKLRSISSQALHFIEVPKVVEDHKNLEVEEEQIADTKSKEGGRYSQDKLVSAKERWESMIKQEEFEWARRSQKNEESEKEYSSALITSAEARKVAVPMKGLVNDWAMQGQPFSAAERHQVVLMKLLARAKKEAFQADPSLFQKADAMEEPPEPDFTLQQIRKDAQSAQCKLKAIVAPKTVWAQSRMNDPVKIPHGSEERSISNTGLAMGGVATDPGIKGSDRVQQKAESRRRSPNDPLKYHLLVDICRLGITYDTVEALVNGMKGFQEKADICWVDNKFRSPSLVGYSDVNLGVRIKMPGDISHIAEVQLSLKLMFEAKMGDGHAYYETMRSVLSDLQVPGHMTDGLLRFILAQLETTEGDHHRIAAFEEPPKEMVKEVVETAMGKKKKEQEKAMYVPPPSQPQPAMKAVKGKKAA
eukprot:gnl/MRDRNA2_/MRDRNA2_101881_c0_seq1.p1 gnl/MRDRNA2_/MRDRNA2_101881_c0~~gnl/MRDRNA2_/MRDRNA2_101881_c0_seq1.p1  ORF type:complete len:827 (+),score=191.28 gnl/MRDRNA2_/MRDRNA2_101881_c0_seq1:291-2483(+)